MSVRVSLLQIRLLGGLDLRYGSEPVEAVDSARLQSLLAYLLLHPSRQPRHHLAFLLWPDSSEAQARTNLRQLLHHLRRALPDADRFLEVDHRTLRWRDDAPFAVDVLDFERAAERAEREEGGDDAVRALRDAVELYRGDLLPDCYDEWLLGERERLHQRYVAALERLVEMLEREDDHGGAIRYAELLLRSDPLHEGAYRRLMRLYARSGERARALRVFHTCASVLERELGVQPSPATREAYEALLRAQEAPAPAPAPLMVEWRMVGRAREWEAAQGAWRDAAAGRPRMLAVTGDPGIGKTRLVQELAVSCARRGIATAYARSYAAEGRLAYAPVVEWLRSEAIAPRLAQLDRVWMTEAARLLPELLAQRPDLPRPSPLTGPEQRTRLFEALARALLTGGKPLLLVIDDLQWADQETLEFLHYLVRFGPRVPLLVAGTARDEELAPGHPVTSLLAALRGLDRLVEIRLGPLGEADSTALATELRNGELPAGVAARLHRESEGNPLFLVESIRAGVGAGGEREGIPPKVQSIIEARLAQLSPAARDIVAVAAVVGREFTFPVLHEAGGRDEDELVVGLDELWRRRIVREQGSNAYDFHHDRIREVAYLALSPAKRARLHFDVAAALERLHAPDLDGMSAQIAAHFDRAGSAEAAVSYYVRAAGVAHAVFANEEVIAFLTRALELLRLLPEESTRDERELELLTSLGVALVAVEGYGSSAVKDVYSRARGLCRKMERATSGPILRGLALAHVARSELQEARDVGDELLLRAEGDGDALLLVEAHYVLGVTAFWRGELAGSRRHLEEALARYDPARHRDHVSLFAQDPKVVCLVRLAYTLWYLGYPDRALAMCDEAVALAEELEHPLSLAYALNFATWLNNDCGRLETAHRLAAAEATLTGRRQLGFFGPVSDVLRAWAEAQGRGDQGAAAVRGAVASLRRVGQHLHLPYALVLLARTHLEAGEHDAARDVVHEGLDFAAGTGHRCFEAEFHRLEGEILAAAGAPDAEVEAALGRALEIAHGQGARSLELRAALSLARWQAGRGSAAGRAGARRLLAGVIAGFTEGHATRDLTEAVALLGHLGAR